MGHNLKNEAQSLESHWHPKVVGRVNDQYVKVARVKGQLAWHQHDDEDELFLVLQGRLRIEYEDRDDVELAEGDFHVVPAGVMHNPVCDEECLIALIEPASTKHTGDLMTDRTVSFEAQMGDFQQDGQSPK